MVLILVHLPYRQMAEHVQRTTKGQTSPFASVYEVSLTVLLTGSPRGVRFSGQKPSTSSSQHHKMPVLAVST